MKTAIVYHSEHHGNTKILLEAIQKQYEVDLIDASDNSEIDLSGYDVIGFASGIYYSKFHDDVLNCAMRSLPSEKKTFLIYTHGMKNPSYSSVIEQILASKNSQVLGIFDCPGFDTFGPLKLVGGIAKGHPNDEDIKAALEFYEQIMRKIPVRAL